ncbi:hypothetical protein, partial [Klebsiella pneumoniae]|uniref:hypothetical protein n=1 Tax=Klebsiella pneumoniae TaxID=573 RepID=UPI003F522FA7
LAHNFERYERSGTRIVNAPIHIPGANIQIGRVERPCEKHHPLARLVQPDTSLKVEDTWNPDKMIFWIVEKLC